MSTHFMRTSEEFRNNPMGTFFDPKTVWQAHAEGQPFRTLQSAIRAGEFLPEVIPEIGLPV